MAKKFDFDYKKFLLEKGEKVGLGVAVGLCVLLLFLGVSSGLTKKSPVGELQDNAKKLKQMVQSAQVKPPEVMTQVPMPETDRDPATTSMEEWLPRYNVEDNKRRNPEILTLDRKAYKAEVVRAPVRVVDYVAGRNLVAVNGDEHTPGERIQPAHLVVVTGRFPFRSQLERFQHALRYKTLDDLLQNDKDTPSFRGFHVFRKDTGPDGKVVTRSKYGEGEWVQLDLDGENSPFRKLIAAAASIEPVDPQRAPVAFSGLVMPKPALAPHGSYPQVDIPGLPKPSEKPKEEEQERPADRMAGGPGMMRPGMMGPTGPSPGGAAKPGGGGSGGAGGSGGRLVRKNWDELSKEMRDQLSGKDVDVFDPNGGSNRANAEGGAGAVPGGRSMAAMGPKGGVGEGRMSMGVGGTGGRAGTTGTTGTTEANPQDKPENALARFIDADVEPGHTYEYMIYVRAKNPNYNRKKDLASQTYSKAKELVSREFTYVGPVHVPYDVFLYAVDERAMYPGNYAKVALRGADHRLVSQTEAAVQIQRWVGRVADQENVGGFGLGAWLVAERLLVRRGEPIGHDVVVDVPVWIEEEGQFQITGVSAAPKAPKGKGRRVQRPMRRVTSGKGVVVDFSTSPVPGLPPAVLVDFQGGHRITYKIGDPVKPDRSVEDSSATEMLILTPDGKLAVHNGRADSTDQDRADRFKEWKKWINKLKGEGKDEGAPKNNRLFDQ